MKLGVIGWIFIISIVMYLGFTLVIICRAVKKEGKFSRKMQMIFSIYTMIELVFLFIYKIC